MRIPRVCIPGLYSKNELIIPSLETENYLIRTLRLSINSTINIFNGKDRIIWTATVQSLKPFRIKLLNSYESLPASDFEFTVALCICKISALELVIQKSTELGVCRVIPVICSHSKSHAEVLNENKLLRLKRIAIEACEQCEQLKIPEICNPVPFNNLANYLDSGARIILQERCSSNISLNNIEHNEKKATILVGPEGGFTSDESHMALSKLNFTPVSLGTRILRCETAVISALSICQFLWGDLN
ncbi:RsmE family RNA methyltransferase [Candidatus Magnetaquicoccus inordinatus]|uniref:RsmE family RNA methyltransferase n=1 Tax=Candidatus Magnetaquicoccus inordinatus TaxID=2496818 RepID=UPI00102B5254|nr:RsmE family RNA methyltransferase [Candidatus Magnetaquicoccus inordinatus]